MENLYRVVIRTRKQSRIDKIILQTTKRKLKMRTWKLINRVKRKMKQQRTKKKTKTTCLKINKKMMKSLIRIIKNIKRKDIIYWRMMNSSKLLLAQSGLVSKFQRREAITSQLWLEEVEVLQKMMIPQQITRLRVYLFKKFKISCLILNGLTRIAWLRWVESGILRQIEISL